MTLQTDGGRTRASRQELIDELQRLAEDHERRPRFSDMDKHGKYSGALYSVRFGSWTDALKEAGIEPPSNPNQRYSDEELLDDLRDFAAELDRTPSSKAMNRDGPHTSKTYKDRFGSWNNALEQTGLEINRTGSTALPEHERKKELLDDLVELATDLKRIPTQKEISEYTTHSHNTYYDYWGGIKEALEASDIDLDTIDMHRTTKPRSITTDELLEELQRLAKELERPPRWIDIRDHGKYSDSPYRARFESLEDAHRAAGIQTDH